MGEVLGVWKLFRESHHRIAEMVAMDLPLGVIRRQLGLSPRRLTLFMQDPAFNELVQQYRAEHREKFEEAADHYLEVKHSNMVQAELAIADALAEHFEPDGQKLSVSMLNKISGDRAERLGYGKNVNIKVEHEFGNRLEDAIRRSRQIEAKAIEVKVVEPVSQNGLPPALPRRTGLPPSDRSSTPLRVRRIA